MGFAEKWAAVEATYFEASPPMDTMDRMDTIKPKGNSVHIVHIVHSIPTPKKGEAIPRMNPAEPVRPSRATCQGQGCAMRISGGRDDPACAWRCIGSVCHGGANPEEAHKPKLADLDACPFGKLAHGTGLDDWPPSPPEGCDFPSYEASGSLLDLCRRHGLHVEVTDGKARIVYPSGAAPALVAYGNQLLEEGRSYILTMRNMVSEMPTGAMQ